jgi:ribosomal protein S27AE
LIIKARKPSIFLMQLETLLKRIKPQHPNRPLIEKDYQKFRAGYNGEKSMDYYLADQIENKNTFLFHDLRLPHKDKFFQLDTLILIPSVSIFLEIKNISGTIFFERKFKQFIRKTKEGVEEGFPDPLLQIERQSALLKKTFSKLKTPVMPLIPLVVISNPNTVIKSNDSTLSNTILHAARVPFRINEILSSFPNEILHLKDMNRVKRALLKQNVPQAIDVFDRYSLKSNDILKGVECRQCGTFKMKKKNRRWRCDQCLYVDSIAYIEALKDFARLYGPSTTNRQLREFCLISSTSVANKILSSLNCPFTGGTKGRVYDLSRLLDG